jgi:RNA polymerase sigma-70 factor (ECF subfamily)
MSEELNRIPVITLYTEHQSWLQGWICHRAGCPHTAEDLTQDTFVRILRKSGQCLKCKEPRAYLTAIAKGLLIDKWRREEIEKAYLDAISAMQEPTAPSSEHLNEIIETLLKIDQALSSLAEKPRRAFMMAQFDGLKYREIAVKLDVSERMVKKYMAQAMMACILATDEEKAVE